MSSKYLLIIYILFLSAFAFAQVPPPSLQQGEYWTQLYSTATDFQSNGSVRYIIQNSSDPGKIFAVMTANHDSSSNDPQYKRFIYCSYSTNNGKVWIQKAVDTSTVYSSASVDQKNEIPLVSVFSGSGLGIRVFSDVSFGSLNFSTLGTLVTNNYMARFPQLSCAANGNIVVTGSNGTFYGYYSFYNGSSWSFPVELTGTGGASGQHSIEAGDNGKMFILGCDYNLNNETKFWTSSNNGETFSLQAGSNAPPSYIYSGADTLKNYVDGGKSGIFIGDEIHLVYSVYSSSSEALSSQNTNWYKKAKIVHWSPSTGIDTVAGRYNIPNLTDTLTQILMTPLCHPSVGYFNGYLYVVFTAFLRGNKQTVNDGTQVNAGEIFITLSSDNGNTWTTPVNLTNTPNIEEKHPSSIRKFTSPPGDSIGVFYLRDMKAGAYISFTDWGKAPVYGIYKKIGQSVIGIIEDLEVTRDFKLFQNYPNPFNPSTKISYYLEKTSFVLLTVYNVLGEEVKILVNEQQQPGVKEISFDAGNLPSGVYFYTLTADDYKDTKTMILLK